MSDNIVVVKLIAMLAIVALLANMMGIGGSPFASLQTALSVEPDLPTFQDPFALKEYVAFIAIPVANRPDPYRPLPAYGHDIYGIYGLDEYFKAIESADGDTSYIRSPEGAGYGPLINEPPDRPADIRVSRIEFDIQARTPDDNVTITIITGVGGGRTFVPAGDSFQNLSSSHIPSAINSGWENLTSEIIIVAYSGDPTATVDISFVRITFYVGGQPECTAPSGAWFPVLDELACQVAQGVDWFITALQFVVNAVIFGFQYIAGWFSWSGRLVGAMASGIVGAMLWFVYMDAPLVIQGLFGILLMVVMGFIFLVFLGFMRGLF